MQGISADLVKAATSIKNSSDSGLSGFKDSLDAMQADDDSQNQELMSRISQQIENVSLNVDSMHEQMKSDMDEVDHAVESVQAEMQDADKRIFEQLATQEARAGKLVAAHEEMLSQLSRNESQQERQEASDFMQELPRRLHDGSNAIMLNLSNALVELSGILGQQLSP
jgi:hypothetical protein